MQEEKTCLIEEAVKRQEIAIHYFSNLNILAAICKEIAKKYGWKVKHVNHGWEDIGYRSDALVFYKGFYFYAIIPFAFRIGETGGVVKYVEVQSGEQYRVDVQMYKEMLQNLDQNQMLGFKAESPREEIEYGNLKPYKPSGLSPL